MARLLAAGAALPLAGFALTGTAAADGSNSTGGSVTLAVRSLTVSPGSVTDNQCFNSYAEWGRDASSDTNYAADGTALALPNGFCLSGTAGENGGPITITNGNAASHIDVQGTAATGAGGAATGTWTLVQSSAPGADQYDLDTISTTPGKFNATGTTTSPTCDGSFEFGINGISACSATANEVSHEDLGVVGPSSSSGTASQYDYTVTWTAAP